MKPLRWPYVVAGLVILALLFERRPKLAGALLLLLLLVHAIRLGL